MLNLVVFCILGVGFVHAQDPYRVADFPVYESVSSKKHMHQLLLDNREDSRFPPLADIPTAQQFNQHATENVQTSVMLPNSQDYNSVEGENDFLTACLWFASADALIAVGAAE